MFVVRAGGAQLGGQCVCLVICLRKQIVRQTGSRLQFGSSQACESPSCCSTGGAVLKTVAHSSRRSNLIDTNRASSMFSNSRSGPLWLQLCHWHEKDSLSLCCLSLSLSWPEVAKFGPPRGQPRGFALLAWLHWWNIWAWLENGPRQVTKPIRIRRV